MNRQIHVTHPSLAPISELMPYLEQIWSTGIMTHNGPLLQRLEREISGYLGLPDLVCVGNGTLAMQLAIRALDLQGEIITTPFTFIATANCIAWERCKPVFVDIDPDTWNLDPAKIQSAITERTCAILPVHVFSAVCDIEQIQSIADKHRLKVIYDAAHSMGVDYKGRSILSYGDVSCVSFHATKLYNTAEGGGCYSGLPGVMERLRKLRFFGFNSQKGIDDEGTNAKMTEVHAAIGLANLPYIDRVKMNRKRKYTLYVQHLQKLKSIGFQRFDPEAYNYSYMPVLFDSEEAVLRVCGVLAQHSITPRRYFHPSLNTLGIFGARNDLAVSQHVAECILCLPLYDALEDDDIALICSCIRDAL